MNLAFALRHIAREGGNGCGLIEIERDEAHSSDFGELLRNLASRLQQNVAEHEAGVLARARARDGASDAARRPRYDNGTPGKHQPAPAPFGRLIWDSGCSGG